MNIYRHKENKKLYIIEHLIRDIKHLNNNEFAGVYATPYKWNGDKIVLNSKNETEYKSFVEEIFYKVAEC